MLEKRFSTTTRPSHGAMNLNEGKPNAKDAAQNAGFTLVAVLVMSLGALGFSLATPAKDTFTGTLNWSIYNVIGMFAGTMVVVISFRFAWSMGNITIRLWEDYLIRLRAWHKAEIDAYNAQLGTEVTNSISIYELDPNVASHVLLTALMIQHRLAHGANNLRTLPWSVRGLEERLELDSGTSSILLGELVGTKPELMSTRLAELGLITNRKPGSAGDWVPQDYDDVLTRIARNWHKLRITR